ncbi:MAG: GNAT family N-acetyltransferase [Novosphingobium sp.]|nr:GNAT family N-acetyltransferase [Novosphingobium sp.]
MASKPDSSWEPAPAQPVGSRGRSLSGRLLCLDRQELANRITDWDSLAAEACEPNPFMESWFLLPALRAFSVKRVKILCFEENSRLRGLMPIHSRYRYYRRPIPHHSNWLHENCFLGVPLVAKGYEVEFWQAVIAWADTHCGASLFFHLGMMTIDGPAYAALSGVLATEARRAELVMSEERALLESNLSPDAYWEASISIKKRKELRRQAARLGEEGELTFDRTNGVEDLARWTEHFLALEAAGWKGQSGSALAVSSATTALFRESLAGAAERGKLEKLTLSLDDKPIAMLANFLTPPGAFSFKTAFDESYSRFSPGVLLQRENLAILENQEIAWTDSCAAADHPMIGHIWRERRAVGHISIAIGGKFRRALFNRLVDAETARKPEGVPA